MKQNPNSVLSGVANVQWPQRLAFTGLSVSISDARGMDAGATPVFPVPDGGSAMLPVLLLSASSHYTMVAEGQLADGNVVRSAPQPFDTQALPPGVPHFVQTGIIGAATEGYTLAGNEPNVVGTGTFYAVAVDGTGKPVWYITLPPNHGLVGDFEKQPDGTYTVAVFDSSVKMPGYPLRLAQHMQYDSLGNLLNTWISPDGVATNEHEFRLLSDGTGLLFGYFTQFIDVDEYLDGGRPDAAMVSSRLERLYPDGGIVFSWDESTHVSLKEVSGLYSLNASPLDPYHANAADVTPDGDYLVGEFNMNHIVKIDSQTGQVLWTLGGKASDFTFVNDPEDGFSLIHGARELPNGHIICFDNGYAHKPQASRAVEYELDTVKKTATLVWQTDRKYPLFSYRFGFAQRLSNGNTLVTYGANGVIDEVGPDGGVIWEISDQLGSVVDGGWQPTDVGFYRAFRIDTVY